MAGKCLISQTGRNSTPQAGTGGNALQNRCTVAVLNPVGRLGLSIGARANRSRSVAIEIATELGSMGRYQEGLERIITLKKPRGHAR
jgi:hypothetical protein